MLRTVHGTNYNNMYCTKIYLSILLLQTFEDERVLNEVLRLVLFVQKYLHEIDFDRNFCDEPVEVLHFLLSAHPQVQLHFLRDVRLQLLQDVIWDVLAKIDRFDVLTEC